MLPLLRPDDTCWRIAQADDFSIIIDADDYFRAARTAMMQAKRSIFLVGWDFDASIVLGHPEVHDEAPPHVGDFLLWLAQQNRELEIRLLLWNPGFISAWSKVSNVHYLLRWKMHRQISVLLDGNHPVGSSHHQKILVIDDSVAFCGGIDVTLDRWDTRKHTDNDPLRCRPNGAPYSPWHDASSVCTGAAAQTLGDLCRNRWELAGGIVVPREKGHTDIILPEAAFSFGAVELAVCRTSPTHQNRVAILEIEKLHVELIGAARQFIYAESQYFASRKIAQAIAKRLAEESGPEIVLITPLKADNWLGSLAMDTARARLRESLRKHDKFDRLRIYHPVTAGGEPIYVHSKLMIVDDRFLRVGSSNFNNRSMRFDNECDVAFDASQDPSGKLAAKLTHLRDNLIAEHLGTSPGAVTGAINKRGSLIAAIEDIRQARTREVQSSATLIPYEVPEVPDLAKWLADNEILDPEGPEGVFEPIEKRGLFRRNLRMPRKWTGQS